MKFLFYVLSHLVVKDGSCVIIFGDESSFNDVTEAYVFLRPYSYLIQCIHTILAAFLGVLNFVNVPTLAGSMKH
jgi:hypothetical protein